MTESIKFGPEWLRNSVANVIAPSPHQQHQQPQSPSTDSIISRPVLSDHRYGREEMLSLCDKTARLPEALPRFRRLFVADWQMPLALQPNTDDEQIGSRGLGGTGTPPWAGTHIRPLMPAMGGRGTGIIRGGAIERGRGRGRGLYHGTSYTRSTSLYDEEGRRWIDRNGTDGTTEWSGGSAVSPRKEGFSRGALESWRKGTREENDEGWRSSSNGTTASTGPPSREKWGRSTSWRETNDNGLSTDADRANGSSQPPNHHQNSSSPTSASESSGGGGGGNGNNVVNSSNLPAKPQASYKKSWDDDGNLPEWATESFDYGGTFDATGAFHDSERGTGNLHEADIERKKHAHHLQQIKQQVVQLDEQLEVEESIKEAPPFPPPPATTASKFMDFLDEDKQKPDEKSPNESATTSTTITTTTIPNSSTQSAPIAQMDKMVENFVAHLIMEDDTISSTTSKTATTTTKQQPVPHIEWFYRDPQGDTQGPFSSSDMSEWYKAGYFQESLMVRRSMDSTFVPLGHLVKIFGMARPFISATLDGCPPIPPVIHPTEIIDPYRMQRIMPQQQPAPAIPPQPAQQPTPDVNNWNMMTAEQRMFLMQLAHQRPPPQPQVDPYSVMKSPPNQQQPAQQQQQQSQSTPLDLRRLMGGNDFFPATAQPSVVPAPQSTQLSEPDPIQQLIMQFQIQQKTGGVDTAQQWIKPSQQQQQQPQQQQASVMMPGVTTGNGPLDLSSLGVGQQGVGQQGPAGGNTMVQNTSSTHWNATPLPIWEMTGSAGAQKDQNQQSLQQPHPTLQEVHQQMRQHHHAQAQQQQQQQHHHQQHQSQSDPDILQNGLMDEPGNQPMQMQKVESKKNKKKEQLSASIMKEQQQQLQNAIKEQSKEKQKQQQAEQAKQQKKANEKQQKKEEKSTQPAAPAPWVGIQQSVPGTSLTKIQKTEAQRRQVELAAQKEREHQKLEMMAKMEIRDVKWNLQMPPAALVKTLDEIQAEEQNAAEREAAMAKREKKEVVTVVGDIWNTGAHSMAWQQPKAWSGGQSNAGFWEDPVKPAAAVQQKQPQLLSKSQTMATISTAKKQPQMPQNIQQQQQQNMQHQKNRNEKIDKKRDKNDKKKDEINNEFTMWCTRTLSAMNGNVDVPTFVSFLQDIESPFEVKDYIKMYLGETKECTEFAKQFLERRSKQRMQQRQQNAHIDDMCSPAPAINPQANNSSSDFQEVKGKNKKVKAKKVMKAVDNRILGFTATSAPDRINVGDRDYGDA